MVTITAKPAKSVGATKVTGMVPPIVTPFRDGAVDYDSLRRHLDDIAEHVQGVLVGGSCAENPSLTFDERVKVGKVVADHMPDGKTLAFSITDNSILNSKRLAEVGAEIGATILMVLCPTYFPNDLAMLEEYFGQLSEFASIDLCIYDNPLVSKTVLSVSDLQALQRVAPRITHLKETDTTLFKVKAVRSATTLTVLAGEDNVLWHQLRCGAEGAMVSMPMIYPARTAGMWKSFLAGDYEAAYEEYRHMTHFIHCSLGAPDYPAVIKAVLHDRGVLASGEVRPPFPQITDARWAEVRASL